MQILPSVGLLCLFYQESHKINNIQISDPDQTHVGSLIISAEQKRLTYDIYILDTLVTHSGLVQEVTDIVTVQNGGTHDQGYKHQFLTNWTRN